jgi:hypothetical protein
MYVNMYVCMYVLYSAYVCMYDLVLHSGKKLNYLLVEGYGIQHVMGCPGVDER